MYIPISYATIYKQENNNNENSERLRNFIEEERINLLNFVPLFFVLLINKLLFFDIFNNSK
jgi:hypothetical protein